MANEIQILYTKGQTTTLYATLHDSTGNVWVEASAGTFEAWNAANLATYKITLTENGTNSGVYLGTITGLTTAGKYTAKAWDAVDAVIGGDALYWNGSAEIEQTEYDLEQVAMDDTVVSGVASNLKEGLAQLWRRFFKKVDKTATNIKTYDDAGSSAVTTQTYTEGDTDTVNSAT